jgi:predicted ribosomally synthesized peptide with nif11-like leader
MVANVLWGRDASKADLLDGAHTLLNQNNGCALERGNNIIHTKARQRYEPTKPEKKEVWFMSIESAKAFLERVKNDEDFRKSVGEIATSEERMEYVKRAGFDFTKDEITNLKDELSDDDLENVAGSVTPYNTVRHDYC